MVEAKKLIYLIRPIADHGTHPLLPEEQEVNSDFEIEKRPVNNNLEKEPL